MMMHSMHSPHSTRKNMNGDIQNNQCMPPSSPTIQKDYISASSNSGSNLSLSHLSIPNMNATFRPDNDSMDVRQIESTSLNREPSLMNCRPRKAGCSHMHTAIKSPPTNCNRISPLPICLPSEKESCTENDFTIFPVFDDVKNDENDRKRESGDDRNTDETSEHDSQLQIAAASSFCLWKRREISKTTHQHRVSPQPETQDQKKNEIEKSPQGEREKLFSPILANDIDAQDESIVSCIDICEEQHENENQSIIDLERVEQLKNDKYAENAEIESESKEDVDFLTFKCCDDESDNINLPHLISSSSLHESIHQDSQRDQINCGEHFSAEDGKHIMVDENDCHDEDEYDDVFDDVETNNLNQDIGKMFRNLGKENKADDMENDFIDDAQNLKGDNNFRPNLSARSRSFSINHQRSLIGSTVGGSSQNHDGLSTSSCSSDGFCLSEPSALTLETSLIVEREPKAKNSSNDIVQKIFIREFSDNNHKIYMNSERSNFQYFQEDCADSFHSEGISTITPISYFESHNSSIDSSSEKSPMTASRCERRQLKRQRPESNGRVEEPLVLTPPSSPQKKNLDFYSVESDCNEFHGLIQNEKGKSTNLRNKTLNWLFSFPITQIFSIGKSAMRRQDDIHYEKHVCETSSLDTNLKTKLNASCDEAGPKEEKLCTRKGVQYAGTVVSHRKNKLSAMKKLVSAVQMIPKKITASEQILSLNIAPSNFESSVESGEITDTDDSNQWIRQNLTVTTAPSSSNSSTVWNRQHANKLGNRQEVRDLDIPSTTISQIPEPSNNNSDLKVLTDKKITNQPPDAKETQPNNCDETGVASPEKISEEYKLSQSDDITKDELRCVVVLLMEPVLRRFEILQLAFDPESTLVGDIVDHVSNQATEAALRKQKYVGLCRPAEKGIEMQNSLLIKKFEIQHDEILVALPRGWSAEACCRLATPILKFNKVQEFAQRHTPTGNVSSTDAAPSNHIQKEGTKVGNEKLQEKAEPVPCISTKENESSISSKNTELIRCSKPMNVPLHSSPKPNENVLNERNELDDTSSITMPSMEDARVIGKEESLLKSSEVSSESVTSVSSPSMSKVIILIMEPISCHFELLLLQFSHDATVSGVVSQVRSMASKKLFEKQNYIGLCRVDGKEMNNHLLMSKYDTAPGEVLIAIPKGLSGASCSLLAKPILRDPNMSSVLGKMTRSARGDDGNPHLNSTIRSSASRIHKPPAIPKMRVIDNCRKENEPPNSDIEEYVKSEIMEKKKVFKRTSTSNCSFSNRSKDAIISLPSITEDNAMDMSKCCPNVVTIVVLVMNPQTRRFELLQLEFNEETALVGGVLAQVRAMVSKKLLKKQSYIGLCRLDGQELINCFNMKKYDIMEGEVLIAIPKGLGGPTCVQLAQPILEYPQIKSFVKVALVPDAVALE